MKYILSFLTLFINVVFVFAQTPYFYNSDGTHGALNDKNWDVITLKLNEEFTTESNTKMKWNYWGFNCDRPSNSQQFYLTDWVGYDNYQNNAPYNFANNHNHTYQTNPLTTVTLTSRKENPPLNTWRFDANYNRVPYTYKISTGLIVSKKAYKYGFFEARFKVNRPAGILSKGLGQCFWLFAMYNNDQKPSQVPNLPNRITDYSEIDIAENDPYRGLMTTNRWYKMLNSPPNSINEGERQTDDCNYSGGLYSQISHNDAFINQTEWHTYSLEWTPTEMNTYYDNKLVKHMDKYASNLDAMNIILDIEGSLTLDGFQQRFCEIINENNLPFDFEIDFVKVYQMNTETCNTPFVYTNYDFSASGYTYGLKSSIKLGLNNSNTASVKVDNGQKISLRAVTEILLEDGFEVDDTNGTEFFVTVNGSCAYSY